MIKPTFKGEQIIESPRVGLLINDAFGKEVAKRVNSQYAGTPAELNSNPNKNQPFKESNILKLFAVDAIARDLDARVMLPEESQLFLELDKMPEKTTSYKDLGLVMDFSAQNHELALHLYNQIDKDNRDLDKFPAIFVGLKPINSDIGDYRLAFSFMPYSQMRTAKVLAHKTFNFDNEDSELIKSGIPSKYEIGNRKFYTSEQKKPYIENLGLVRFYLGRILYLYSDDDYLGSSDEDGRVVVVSAFGASQKILIDYITKEKETRKRYFSKLTSLRNRIDKELGQKQ